MTSSSSPEIQLRQPRGTRNRPCIDPSGVGVTFVDVLFALVIGYALMPLATWWKITAVGWFDLSVAIILTLTSWIGYHNSVNRPRWVISFPNKPLAIFILDILMVVTYAYSVFVANSVTKEASPRPTPLPEAVAVATSFFLYVIWDYVNLRIKRDARYEIAWEKARQDGTVKADFPRDTPARRKVTIYWWVVSLASVLYAVHLNGITRLSRASVAASDVALIILIVSFRFAKEFVTPSTESPPMETVPHTSPDPLTA